MTRLDTLLHALENASLDALLAHVKRRYPKVWSKSGQGILLKGLAPLQNVVRSHLDREGLTTVFIRVEGQDLALSYLDEGDVGNLGELPKTGVSRKPTQKKRTPSE